MLKSKLNRPVVKRIPTEADILMWQHLKELRGNVRWAKEYKFHPERLWRFDFCVWGIKDGIPFSSWAIEIEGGHWTNGAHVRGKHFESDMSKYNHAALLGWRVLRFTTKQVLKGEAITFIKKVLES